MFKVLNLSLMLLLFTSPSWSKGDDVLQQVSKKLDEIEKSLKNQHPLISPETITWPELEAFNNELMYVQAHDPNGVAIKDLPAELNSEKLTEQLAHALKALEESVPKIATMPQTQEWLEFKQDVDQYIQLRRELLYQNSRQMVKTGQLSNRIKALRLAAADILKHSPTSNKISFRVLDPVLEGLSVELKQLNHSVRQLDEIRNPKKAPTPSIYQKEFLGQVAPLVAGSFVTGAFLVACFFWYGNYKRNKKLKQAAEAAQEISEAPVKPSQKLFDYGAWMKELEKNLMALKAGEDNLVEDMLCLINYSHDLRDAREALEVASPEDYGSRLKSMKVIAMKIERYAEKINMQKNKGASKKVMKDLIKICEAIEHNYEFCMDDESSVKTIVKYEAA